MLLRMYTTLTPFGILVRLWQSWVLGFTWPTVLTSLGFTIVFAVSGIVIMGYFNAPIKERLKKEEEAKGGKTKANRM